MRHAAKVGCVHPTEPKTQPGRDPRADKPAEEELEMMWAWLHDQDLLEDHNSKNLPLEWAVCRFWALSKCQFGNTVVEALCCSAHGCCAVECSVACCAAQHTAIATLTLPHTILVAHQSIEQLQPNTLTDFLTPGGLVEHQGMPKE